MKTLLQGQEPGGKWLGCMTLGWSVAVLAADLKVSVGGHIHWLVTALAVVLVLPWMVPAGNRPASERPEGERMEWDARTPAWLLIVAVCVPILYGAVALYSLLEAAKIAVILLGGLFFFTSRRYLPRAAFCGFVIAVGLNAALLLGGLFGYGSAEIMGSDRWGTVLNYPGSLWRVGITVWVFSAYLFAVRRSVASLILLLASTFVVYMDGARTAILIIFAGGIYLVCVLAAEAGHLKRALLIATSGLILLAASVLMTGIVQGQPSGKPEGGFERVGVLTGALQEQGYDGLELADAARFQMLEDAVAAIRSHPVLGSGIITTTTESTVGPQAVHMTYLQVWADLGLLGLMAYVWLVWGWIPRIGVALRCIRRMPDPAERALHHNAIFLLLVNGLIGFFHPLSTEWSEWIIFLVASAMFWPVAAGGRNPFSVPQTAGAPA